MPNFQYKALSSDGQTVSGSISAGTRPEAIAQLKGQGFRPLRLDEQSARRAGQIQASRQTVSGQTASEPSVKRSSRVSRRDVQVFTGQLAALLKAGIVLSQSLTILEEQTESAGLAEIIRHVHQAIHDGASLSEALAQYPRYFPKLYCSMVRVGESGGVLDVVLNQLAGFMEAENALRSNIMTALAYPALVVMVGVGSILVLITFVIPRLSSVFADFGDRLPWLTSVLIESSHFFLAYWWWFAMFFGLAVYGLRRAYQDPRGRELIDRLQEKTPGLGPVIVKSHVSRFARTMGTLIDSGIPVLNALHLVVDTTTSSVLEKRLREVCEKVKKGEGVAQPLRETGFFPPMVTNLIAVGEESGALAEMMFQIAETYDQEVQHAIKRFITLFEPLVIVLMAIGVGGILFAFLLPILNIGNMVQ